MNIILDTNIYVQNYLLNSRNFELLFDYLKKTNSKILVPRIIIDELLENYRSTLLVQLEVLEKARNKLESILVEGKLSNNEIDIELEVSNYLKYFLGKLIADEKSIIEHKANYLDELIARAIKRIKPFSDKGEEFRDALIWLVVLDATTEFGGIIGFISNDSKAFGQAGTLYKELLDELEARNIQVNYFTSIKNFIEQQATHVEFVNENWLSEIIDFEQYDRIIEEKLSEILENRRLYPQSRRDWKDLEYTGYINRTTTVDQENIYAFYVYEKSDGSLFIEVQYYVEYEIEFYIEQQWGQLSGLSSSFDDETDIYQGIKTKPTFKYGEAEIIFGVDVRDRNVINIEIISVYI